MRRHSVNPIATHGAGIALCVFMLVCRRLLAADKFVASSAARATDMRFRF